MIFTLIAWLYISFICFTGGGLVGRMLRLQTNETGNLHFSAICFLGISALGLLGFYVSLCIPISPWVRYCLQLPLLVYGLASRENRQQFISAFQAIWKKAGLVDYLLLVLSMFIILIISTAPVIHPDTLNYHRYAVLIFNDYGILKGSANLQTQLGFQSLWFSILSVFDFSGWLPHQVFLPAGCLMAWFVLFTVSEVRQIQQNENNSGLAGGWWTILFLFCIISWTQIRLTAASASPDFIAAISVWAAFYFLLRTAAGSSARLEFLLTIWFASLALAIKLSVFMASGILLGTFAMMLIRKKYHLVLTGLIVACLLLAPLLIRNVLATGYALYPASFPDLFHVDWKLSSSALSGLRHYITDYARYPVVSEIRHSSWLKWLPLWWKHLYAVDKLLIVLILAGFLLMILRPKHWLKRSAGISGLCFVLAFSGSIVWMFAAPDPRFGTGFLVPLIYFEYAPFIIGQNQVNSQKFQYALRLSKYVICLALLGYSVHRILHFFLPGQMLYPEGVVQTIPASPDCSDAKKAFVFPESGTPGALPDSCKTFRLRGAAIADGLKPFD
ncbi:MAG TPA: hypothetical protein VG890_03870 [Puia sp.]|nr:hypothetical protein [Puia sp.]